MSTSTSSDRRLDGKRRGRFVVGAVTFVSAVAYTIEAFRLSFGTMGQPGPGFYPRVVGIGLLAVSLLTCLEALLTRSVSGSLMLPTGSARRKVLIVLGSMVLYVVLLPVLGQYIVSSAFFVGMLRLLGKMSWLKAAIGGVVLGVAISAFFLEVLAVRPPTGLLFG
ncbi:MAG: tripartite tricarboxylate transporter TctB family protein [Streptosporangiales bacterium]|nr:tripartite tricarboxylate transporter TctB family protein [Streptosporangiales bacterium]